VLPLGTDCEKYPTKYLRKRSETASYNTIDDSVVNSFTRSYFLPPLMYETTPPPFRHDFLFAAYRCLSSSPRS